jgi:hypothetical protein
MSGRFPVAHFLWLDVEADAEQLHPFDEVETFPTILIARENEPLFWGPVTPEPGTLARLIQVYEGSATNTPETASLAQTTSETTPGLSHWVQTLYRRYKEPDKGSPVSSNSPSKRDELR